MNDSTGCFIPVKGDTAYFRFMFSDSVGLDSTSLVYFNIEDRNGDSVYLSPISITDIHFDTTMFNLPGINAAVIPITWNGRYNVGEHNGHFADPENDPYLAYISVNPRSGNPMYSNADTAYVVPKIESVFITHRPYWPPPAWGDSVTLYSIVKARVDDASGQPDSVNCHYYYPDFEDTTIALRRWARTNYLFRSADNIGFAEDNRAKVVYPFLPWHTFDWGMLHYKWYVTRDSANNTNGCNPAIYYYSVDTTEQWGDRWNPVLKNNLGYEEHHRIYVTNTVINRRPQQFTIQTKATAGTNSKAHKVIFGSTANLCEIAETHLGTPYWMNNKKCNIENRDKKPYDWIDCSGFVTAIKIQDRGYERDTIYSLNNNGNVRTYVKGFYMRGSNRVYISDQIPESLVTEGDLIAMAPKPSRNVSDTAWSHIMLITYCEIIRGKITNAKIIHARGDSNASIRKVRYDDLYSRDNRVFKFLRYR